MVERKRGVLVFGEVNLDIYVRFSLDTTYVEQSAASADIEFELGGNTWNIAKTLQKLGRKVMFICTSSKDDISITLLKSRSDNYYPDIEFIPGIATLAPRFVAVDKAERPILRAIQLPNQTSPDQQQLKYLSDMLRKHRENGYGTVVLASSIETEILECIILESKKLNMQIVGAISSAPTVNRFAPALSYFDILILNLSEAQALTSVLGLNSGAAHEFAHVLSQYAKNSIVTMGADTLYAYSENGLKLDCTPPFLGKSFVNDLGAGDAFAAFLIDAFTRTGKWVSAETLAWATAGATLVCQNKKHIIEEINREDIIDRYEEILQQFQLM